MARAARSVEKLADTLSREFPPTVEAIRLTGLEISELTDDVSEGVQSAGKVAKQVDKSIVSAKQQAQNVQVTTRSVMTGIKAAWKSFTRKPPVSGRGRGGDRLSPSQRGSISIGNSGLDDDYYRGYDAGLPDHLHGYGGVTNNGESGRTKSSDGSNLPEDSEEFERARSKDS
jgi:hypothetical protein